MPPQSTGFVHPGCRGLFMSSSETPPEVPALGLRLPVFSASSALPRPHPQDPNPLALLASGKNCPSLGRLPTSSVPQVWGLLRWGHIWKVMASHGPSRGPCSEHPRPPLPSPPGVPPAQGPRKAQPPALGCVSEDVELVTPGTGGGARGRALTHGQGRHEQDEEVQSHGHGHRCQQPGIQPRRHPQQRLVL